MAITLKPDPDKGWVIMALFDVSPSMIAAAKSAGVQCVQTNPGTFVVKKGQSVYGTIPVKGTALTLAQNKALGPNSKIAFKANFESALNKAMGETSLKNSAVLGGVSNTAMPKTAPLTTDSTVGQLPIVKLCDATELYQQVKGTSQGSIYRVFALFPGLKLAARVSGYKMSVRAEGDGIANYKAELVDAFKMDLGSGYVSAHYSVNEGVPLIIKTLGAIVGTLGFNKANRVADLKVFVELLS